VKKEKKKKSEEKDVRTKKPQLASRLFVAAFASVLSAAQASIKGKCPMQSTTELSRAISPHTGGERTVVSLLAKKLPAMSF